MTLQRRTYSRPLAFLLVWMAMAILLVHSLAGGTLLETNLYNSYALQAENWLAGRNYIANGENYAWLELAIFEGRYYLSFPPVPTLLFLPWVALSGGTWYISSNLIIAGCALVTAAGVFELLRVCGASPARCVWGTALVVLGSNFLWMSTNGGVWFEAQVLNLCLVAWGLRLGAARGAAAHTAAAFLLALAVGCRPFSILILGLYLLHVLRADGKKGVLAPVLAAAVVGACLAGYNFARFGSLTEFGHNYLPEFMRNPSEPQFGLQYFVPNLIAYLRPVKLTAALDLSFPIFNGFLLFAANPVFFVWAVQLFRRGRKGELSVGDGVCIAGFLAGLCALCMHKTLGGWQFGARYTVDLIPYVLLSQTCFFAGGLCRGLTWRGLPALLRRADASGKTATGGAAKPAAARTDTLGKTGKSAAKAAARAESAVQTAAPLAQPLSQAAWFVCGAAVLFNFYGAVYMLSH